MTIAGPASDHNSVLVRDDSAGTVQWARTAQPCTRELRFQRAVASQFYGVGTDGDGQIYVAGYQSGTGSFAYASTVNATGKAANQNSLAVKYKPYPVPRAARADI